MNFDAEKCLHGELACCASASDNNYEQTSSLPRAYFCLSHSATTRIMTLLQKESDPAPLIINFIKRNDQKRVSLSVWESADLTSRAAAFVWTDETATTCAPQKTEVKPAIYGACVMRCNINASSRWTLLRFAPGKVLFLDACLIAWECFVFIICQIKDEFSSFFALKINVDCVNLGVIKNGCDVEASKSFVPG